jgi:hypothetical protein
MLTIMSLTSSFVTGFIAVVAFLIMYSQYKKYKATQERLNLETEYFKLSDEVIEKVKAEIKITEEIEVIEEPEPVNVNLSPEIRPEEFTAGLEKKLIIKVLKEQLLEFTPLSMLLRTAPKDALKMYLNNNPKHVGISVLHTEYFYLPKIEIYHYHDDTQSVDTTKPMLIVTKFGNYYILIR